jgi:hypothetical protein
MPAFGLKFWCVIGALLLAGGLATLAWQVQDWRYEGRLAEQARLHAEALNQLTLTAATAQQAEQDKRLALEQRLTASEQTHYRALNDAQRDQDRLRDRLATAPAAWIMQPYAPDLTRRMLDELSPSPAKATAD